MWDNDIVFPHLSFAGPDSFYVTNDNFFHFDSTVMRSLWTFFLNYWLHCDIVFFDGFKGVEAIGGVHPNGITMDKDERLVRVSIKCGAQRPIGNSEREKKRVCASVVRFSKLLCCFQTLPQGLRFLCPVEWTIFFLNWTELFWTTLCSASEWLRQISLAAQKAINQKYFPEQGSDPSSVWNFCAWSSGVIWRENQWPRLVSQVAAIAEISSGQS